MNIVMKKVACTWLDPDYRRLWYQFSNALEHVFRRDNGLRIECSECLRVTMIWVLLRDEDSIKWRYVRAVGGGGPVPLGIEPAEVVDLSTHEPGIDQELDGPQRAVPGGVHIESLKDQWIHVF